MGANGNVNVPSGIDQIFGDLRTGRTGTDDQHATWRQLAWVGVAVGGYLDHPWRQG